MSDQQRLLEAVIRVEAMSQDITEIKQSTQKMAEAITKLAVVEERQAHDRAEIGRVFKRLDTQDQRIQTLELAQPLQKQATDWVGKAVWAVLSAVLTAVLSLVLITAKPAAKTDAIPQLTMPAK
jgi:hypothetical protein